MCVAHCINMQRKKKDRKRGRWREKEKDKRKTREKQEKNREKQRKSNLLLQVAQHAPRRHLVTIGLLQFIRVHSGHGGYIFLRLLLDEGLRAAKTRAHASFGDTRKHRDFFIAHFKRPVRSREHCRSPNKKNTTEMIRIGGLFGQSY